MAKFNFYLREKSKDTETPIILFINFQRIRLKYPTGKTIIPKFWNESEQVARQVKDFPLAKIFNDNLKFIKRTAEKEFESLIVELKRNPSLDELKKRLDEVLKKSSNLVNPEGETPIPTLSFLQLFKRFIEDSETGIRPTSTGKRFDKRSIQKYCTVYDTLKDFGQKYNLTFESIDKNFYSQFVAFLNRKKYTVNTVGKYVQVIKTFMTFATENGYNTNLFFKSKQFKTFSVAGFSIYLTDSEIQSIYEEDLSSSPYLERVRDLFIVGCWTGLRFSDFTAIKPESIEQDFLQIKTFKTGEKVVIPIHPLVREIMSKYQGKYPNSLPPAISNQKMNNYLKEICKNVKKLKVPVETECQKGGLKITETKEKWELVTTHTARRSFATNVFKSGFPAISLMKITGHKTEKSFLLYIKVTPEENAQKLLSHWNKSILKVS